METRFSLTVFVIISCLLFYFSVTCVGTALKNLQSKGVKFYKNLKYTPKFLDTNRVIQSSFILWIYR